jgi:3-hydroxy-9,10-secoandrosta-1,3,5(10)-triene-9,17-dione monooxygenase reductase component
MTTRTVDPETFRSALSRFASGVTVLTTHTQDGRDLGMTASAFSSVSLDPPLVLVCVGHEASMASPLQHATHLAVHVLSADQESLSRRFADVESDRFTGLEITRGAGGVPMLDGALARLQCRIVARHPGGDHVIVVAEVLEAHIADGEPLLYFRGRYARPQS